MDIVKKNVISIIFGVIAILAIVSLFYPLGGMYDELQKQAQSRASVYSSMESLLKKPRTMPLLDPKSTEATPLPYFPNQKIIEEGDALTKRVAQQSIEMLRAVVDVNTHTLLVPGSLPSPDTQAFVFRDEYGKEMNERIPNEVLKAGVPPTAEQEKIARERLLADVFEPRIIHVNGRPINEVQVKQEFEEEAAKIPQRLKEDVAKKSRIYMNPDALTIQKELFAAARPDAIDVWWAQVSVWIQRDICQAIADANRDSKGIPESVVKHLIKLESRDKQFVGIPPMALGPGSTPTPLPAADPNAPPPKNFTISPTGRISNGLYDVVSWKLTVNVDAARLTTLLTELSRNRLITVTRINNIVPVDPLAALSNSYVYGPQPVVQMVLEGESLLLRSWTEQYMPRKLRTALGIPDPQAAAPAGQ